MPSTYLFYDLETSGLNKCFDQVMQFAAIRTDMNFNELERYNFYIKLQPDTLPSPGASITHRISLSKANQGLDELRAMEKIHAIFNTPGTISLGYNTLEFDDEFLRFSFYRNLLTPYTHQYANQCSRMDIYPMTLMYYLYKPDVIEWPSNEKGHISLKLENINKLNQFASGQAHDALTDIEATLGLCKALHKDQSMWHYICGYFNKKTDHERFLQLDKSIGQHREALLVQGRFGSKNQFQSICLHLGDHVHYRNQSVWLRLDDERLQNTTIDSIEEHPWVINKKMAEPPFILPLEQRFLNKISSARKQTAKANKKWLQENPKILQAIIDYYTHYEYPTPKNVDPAASLYISDFWTREETALCQEFHRSHKEGKFIVFKQLHNSVLHSLALRLLAQQDYQLLNTQQQHDYQTYLDSILKPHNPPHDFRGEVHTTPDKVHAEIAKLREHHLLDEQQQKLLSEIEVYLKDRQKLIS